LTGFNHKENVLRLLKKVLYYLLVLEQLISGQPMMDYAYHHIYAESQNGNPKSCKVYDTKDNFTAFVQGLLAALALASLYLKRMNETPRRKFLTWWFDVSKQAIGATYAHFLNMVIAAVINDNVRGDYDLDDQCAWYAINFLIDTTLGLFLSVILLRLMNKEAKKRQWESLINSGVYIGEDAILHWLHQLLSWIAILSLVKVMLIFILWIFSPFLALVGDILFKPIQSNIRLELMFVMIFFPGFLNVFYFWIADGYLKAGSEHSCAHENNHKEDRKSLQEESFVYHGGEITEECDYSLGTKRRFNY